MADHHYMVSQYVSAIRRGLLTYDDLEVSLVENKQREQRDILNDVRAILGVKSKIVSFGEPPH